MKEKATIAGGCYWCFDALYRLVKGVEDVQTGYSGGTTEHPTMMEVYGGKTKHAEAVQITFDNEVITYKEIIEIFFTMHDPTTVDRQGNDVGDEYRSMIFYENDEQKQTAEDMKANFAPTLWDDPIVTEIVPLDVFWPADEDNQDFFNKNPYQGYCQVIIDPKVQKFRQKFAEKYYK